MGCALVFLGGVSDHLCCVAGARILCAGADLAVGIGAVRGAVRVVATDPGAGESAAAGDYCIRGDFVAGGYCGEGGGVSWQGSDRTQ